jgi:Domain of unknown function (DUF2019)
MVPQRRSQASNAALVEELTAACTRPGDAVGRGDTARANREFDRAMNVARELLSRGRPASDAILDLLGHENPYVRKEVAFLALEIEPQRGEEVLAELGRNYSDLDIGFAAGFTLEQWRAGKLKTLSQWDSFRGRKS